MARLPRLVLPDIPLHIIHRWNNRQELFKSEEDALKSPTRKNRGYAVLTGKAPPWCWLSDNGSFKRL